ncbi:MAG TPA: hypothetical protein VIQ30_01265 [Pseudonocardia sp.]
MVHHHLAGLPHAEIAGLLGSVCSATPRRRPVGRRPTESGRCAESSSATRTSATPRLIAPAPSRRHAHETPRPRRSCASG